MDPDNRSKNSEQSLNHLTPAAAPGTMGFMEKRQIVFIMTDTQRWDMVGCYGNGDMKTPNLDRLAAEGIRFSHAYTCQPVCGPARSAIFTGTYPHSNGSWANSMPLGANVKTVGERVRENGIHTGYIGKWHLDGGDYFGLGTCPAGWDPDYWYDMKNYLDELTPEERLKSRKPETMEQEDIPAEFTFAHRCSNRAVHFLEQYQNDDFLLCVSYDEPHHPSLCPDDYWKMYEDYEFPKSANIHDELGNKPAHQRAWAGETLQEDKESLSIQHKFFFGCNSFVDAEIGRVLQTIDRLMPNALVIYTSDHGDFLHSHSLNGKGPAAYDEITRVPFIVRKPGTVPSGTVYDGPVSQIDCTPTMLDFLGLPAPAMSEGKSMLPLFKDPTTRHRDKIFLEYTRYEIDHDGFGGFQPLRSVFDGRYKLTINLLSSDELYDMERDPAEMENLIDSVDHEEIRNRLHNDILAWMNETRDPFRGYYWERRPWRTDARPATWRYTNMTRQKENEPGEERQLDYATGLEIEKAVRVKE